MDEDTSIAYKNGWSIKALMMTRKSLWITLFVFLLGCDNGITEKQKLAAIEQDKKILAYSCKSFASRSTPIGDLQNNVWNALGANGFDWTQCIAMRTIAGKTQYGWYWQWPENGDVVYAQPQITLGNTPWTEHQTIKAGYPIDISALDKLQLNYDIEIASDGEYNLTSTLWLTNSSRINPLIDKSSIQAEVMIWTYSTDDFYGQPAGEEVGEVTVDGIEWEVWVDKKWYDTSGLNDNNWTYLAFRATENTLKAQFDIGQLLRYSINKNLIKPNLYIADIQLGTEIMSGTGQAWLNRYELSPTVKIQVK